MKELVAHPLTLAAFGAILPEEIDWKPFPAFPPSAGLAVVVGEPSQKGLYTVRVRVPHGVKLMPHRHREDRVYTVISGIFYIGLGDRFDAETAVNPSGVVMPITSTSIGRVREYARPVPGGSTTNAGDDPSPPSKGAIALAKIIMRGAWTRRGGRQGF